MCLLRWTMEGYTQKSGSIQNPRPHCSLICTLWPISLYTEKLQCSWKTPSKGNKCAGEKGRHRDELAIKWAYSAHLSCYNISMCWPLPNLSTSAGYPTNSQLFQILIPVPMMVPIKKSSLMFLDDLLVTDMEQGFWPLVPDVSSSEAH